MKPANPARRPTPSRRQRITTLLMALGAGALSVGGFAPLDLWPLTIASLALLFLLWQRWPGMAFVSGLAWGLGAFGVGVSWVYVSLHQFGAMLPALAVAATALLALYLALWPALAGLVGRHLLRGGPGDAPILAAAWCLTEWLRGVLFTGFPWLAVGYSQVPHGPLAPLLPLGGIHLANFAVALAAALVARILLHPRGWPAWAALTLLLTGSWALGRLEFTHVDGPAVTVSLLQGNVEQTMKWEEEQIRHSLLLYDHLLARSQGQLVLAPETALPAMLQRLPAHYLARLRQRMTQRDGDLVIGVPEDDAHAYFNSAITLGSSPAQTYRKEHLVPFGEYIPLRRLLGGFVGMVSIPLQDFGRGRTDPPPLRVAGLQLGMTICYEDLFSELVRQRARQAGVLANLSNDAWFGESFAPWQHQQIAATRALETGRPLLRVTQTGVTAIIDHRGRVRDTLPAFTSGILETEVRPRSGDTPWSRLGAAPTLLASLLLLLLARRRRQR